MPSTFRRSACSIIASERCRQKQDSGRRQIPTNFGSNVEGAAPCGRSASRMTTSGWLASNSAVPFIVGTGVQTTRIPDFVFEPIDQRVDEDAVLINNGDLEE